MPHKLLLADDSITIQRVIELTFAEEDVQVLAVGDGKHAIDRIQVDRPDIVLADVGMPERDGYEVAAFVKSNPQLAHIPVLLLTGAFEPIDETRARAVGCDGVLVKPFEPQMVINRVKDLLAGRRPGGSGTPTSNPSTGEPQGSEPLKAPGDSLEDYFDRLDAAFATLGTEAPAPASAAAATAAPSRPAGVEDFASWDPDLAGDASRPAIVPPAAVAPPPAPPVVEVEPRRPPAIAVAAPKPLPPPAPVKSPAPAPPAAPVVTSATPAAPASTAASSGSIPAIAPAAPQVSLAEAFAALLAAEHGQAISPAARRNAAPAPDVDDIVRRVLDRLQDPDMRQTVIDVAERVVREEIDRIKRANS